MVGNAAAMIIVGNKIDDKNRVVKESDAVA